MRIFAQLMTMKETISRTDDARSRPSYSYRDIWKIVFPLLLSSIVEQLVGMTDTAFLGRVGRSGVRSLGTRRYLLHRSVYAHPRILFRCANSHGAPQWGEQARRHR